MVRLNGERISTGTAMGVAAVFVRGEYTLRLPPQIAEMLLACVPEDQIDPVDIVLIAHDLAAATSVSSPALHVVGIALEASEMPQVSVGVPIVAGVAHVTDIAPGSLVLIDAGRATVTADPDWEAIAAFQNERNRLRTRTRYFLDFSHQPVQLSDGQRVQVIARCPNQGAAQSAVDLGADALYVVLGSLQGGLIDAELSQLADTACGRPVSIYMQDYRPHVEAICRGASMMDLVVIMETDSANEPLERLREQIEPVQVGLSEQGVLTGHLRFGLRLNVGQSIPEELESLNLARIIVESDPVHGVGDAESMEWLHALCTVARPTMTQVAVTVERVSPQLVTTLVKSGATGVVVGPGAIQTVKSYLRDMQ